MGESDELSLDLSVRDVYVIVHYKDCDPGNEYEILNEKQISGDSWVTLEQGAEVTVKFGNARVQASVVMVSDELETLQTHLKSLREEYTAAQQARERARQMAAIKMEHDHQMATLERNNLRQQIIKVKDKGTQTDPDERIEKLNREKAELEAKYESVQKQYRQFRLGIEGVLNKADDWENKNDYSDNKNVFPLKKERILKESNRHEVSEGVKSELAVVQGDMVYIGSKQTAVPKVMFDSVNWLSYSAATRKLLVSVFPRKILATHCLTGKPSPAFLGSDKQAKMRLDPIKIGDIVEVVSQKCHVSESLVRSAITTKCADENKMYRKRIEKKAKLENDENAIEIKRQRQ